MQDNTLECDAERNNNNKLRMINNVMIIQITSRCMRSAVRRTQDPAARNTAPTHAVEHTHPKISFVENRAGMDETPVKYSNRCGRTPDAPKISVSRPTVSIQQKQSISCVCHCMDSTRQSKRVSGETPHTKSTLTCETTSTNNTTRLKFM